jgi:hypothetical protein
MEASLSLSDDAGHGVASCPQEVSVWDLPGEPALPDMACEAAFRSESLSVFDACLHLRLVEASRRQSCPQPTARGKPRWSWKSTFAWPAYGRPEIKVIALGLSNRHYEQEGARGFTVSQAPLVAGVPRAHLGCRREG